ncbi:sodium channel and clathrin linker 1-like isoform X1 [Mytilus californianus]|uniref:sodium channel and clathrin linker 1-like isoform X1 n=1 Tax=Mytilus californianus TaxID=6549 RepID=UPI002247157A|nr:sodium channel and clathrin linker 1-like isoform X1 [Mytilus californianus]
MNSDLNKKAEESQKTVKNLLSQLAAATSEDTKINKLFQEANKRLQSENEKKCNTIKDLNVEVSKLKNKLKETKEQKENTEILETKKKLQNAEQAIEILKRQEDDTKKKLQNAEQDIEILKRQKDDTKKKLQNAEQDIEILKRQKDDTERDYLETIQELENKLPESSVDCIIDHHKHLEDQVKHLTTENSELRDQVDTLIKEKMSLQENISSLEQEKNAFKQQIDSWIAKKHSTVHIQMYAAVNRELCEKMMNELEDMLRTQFEINQTIIEVDKYKNPPPDSRDPLIVICINASRLGTDVIQAISQVNRSRTQAVVVLHHKEYHALPRQPSEKLLIGSDYKHIGAIVDIAYLTTRGIYTCDMNEKSLDKLVNFIKVNSQSK